MEARLLLFFRPSCFQKEAGAFARKAPAFHGADELAPFMIDPPVLLRRRGAIWPRHAEVYGRGLAHKLVKGELHSGLGRFVAGAIVRYDE